MHVKTQFSVSLFSAAITLPAVAQACSVCFSGDGDALTHAFNWSVGFLLAAPYAIAGSIAGCLTIAYRKAVAKRAELEERGAQDTINPLIWAQEENAK